MYVIAFGGNLPGEFRDVLTCQRAALARLQEKGLELVRFSRWFRTPPFPLNDQPDFVNGVGLFDYEGSVEDLMDLLQAVEAEFKRERQLRWGARTLDLDLLAAGDLVLNWPDGDTLEQLVIPHPRLHERSFVLHPLCDILADWRHPVLGRTVRQLLAVLPEAEGISVICEAGEDAAGAKG